MRPGRGTLLAFALTSALLAQVGSARANLVINPTYDSSITNDANAATIMATINGAIAQYESLFSDNITVNIKFQEGGGLGSSSTWIYQMGYQNYRAALAADATSADDATALSTLPIQATSPVDNNVNMWITHANLAAIETPAGATPDGFDGTITLNTSLMNLDRNNIDPNKYDLQAVAQHEIDEVLGMGSGLNLPAGFPRLSRPQDLFRYSANGVRSYTTNGNATSYFSIDGGLTNLVNFNQNGNGDYGDWYSTGPHTPRVQDAFGTPGATQDLGVEIRNLDVIGYTLATHPVPEPGTLVMAMTAATALMGFSASRRKSS